MNVTASGIAILRVNATDEIIMINADDLVWEREGTGEERQMGPEIEYSAEYSIKTKTGDSYKIKWNVWEYPIGFENTNETSVPRELSLLQDIQYSLEHEPEVDESEQCLKFG